MSPIVLRAARTLVGCGHEKPCAIRTGIDWCPGCGSLRYAAAGGSFLRPSGVSGLGQALGPLRLSPDGYRLFLYVDGHEPFGIALDDVVGDFGMAAVFECVQAGLLETDAWRRVATLPPPQPADPDALAPPPPPTSGVLRVARP